jgi:hypothetical protein
MGQGVASKGVLMRRSLKKTVVGVSVTYSDGDFSNNLMGSNIELDELPDCLCVSIDLTRNLRVRNKQANCFYDASQLVERYAKLSSIQIDDKQIFEGLAGASKRFPGARWELRLVLGEKGVLKYSARPRGSAGSIIFHMLSIV